jgi:hypothetical protein
LEVGDLPQQAKQVEVMCGLEDGLWPLMWVTLIICITVYNVLALKWGKDQ